MQSWQLLSASKTITIHSPDIDPSAPVGEYNPHRGIVNSAVYNHVGKVIASCGQDGKIALHNAAKCQDKLMEFWYHSGLEEPSSVNCCLFSPKSKYIAAASVNTTVKVWDTKFPKDKEPFRKLKGHTGAVTSIGWANYDQMLVSGSTSGDILIHDVLTGALRDSFITKAEGVSNLKVSEEERHRRLAACTNSGSIMVWDLNASSKKPFFQYEDDRKSPYTSLTISSFRPVFMAVSSMDKNIVFMDVNEKKVIKTVSVEESLTSISFNDDGQLIAAGGINGGLFIYDLKKLNAPLYKLSGHDTPIKSVCFSEKEKDPKFQRRDKQYSMQSSNAGRSTVGIKQINPNSNTEIPIEKEPRTKTLTPVMSTNKLSAEDDRGNQSRVRNLAKKEEQPPQLAGVASKINPVVSADSYVGGSQIPSQNYVPASQATQARPAQSQVMPPNSTSSVRPSSHSPSTQLEVSPGQLKVVEDRLMGEMRSMEMRFNQKFQSLHLQVIRQMQLSVEKIAHMFERNNQHKQELEQKIRALQQENQSLKKRSY